MGHKAKSVANERQRVGDDMSEDRTKFSERLAAVIATANSMPQRKPRQEKTGLAKVVRECFEIIEKCKSGGMPWNELIRMLIISGAEIKNIETLTKQQLGIIYRKEKKRREKAAGLPSEGVCAQKGGDRKTEGGQKAGGRQSVVGDGVSSVTDAPVAVKMSKQEQEELREANQKKMLAELGVNKSIADYIREAQEELDISDEEELELLKKSRWSEVYEAIYYGYRVVDKTKLKGPPEEWDVLKRPVGLGKFSRT